MRDFEFSTGRYYSDHDQGRIASEWQSNYRRIVKALSKLGTEVSVDKIEEGDSSLGTGPQSLVKGAKHEFVFPPQRATIIKSIYRVFDAESGRVTTRNVVREYDEDLVEGHLRVEYDDASGRVLFGVTDLLDGESRLPEGVSEVLETVQKYNSNQAK